MIDICVVTTFQREELLYLCLEAIRTNDPKVSIWVFSDRGAKSEELLATCDKFEASLSVRGQHDTYGNSWNLLGSLIEIMATTSFDFIHIIEDDTILHRGYLAWARERLASRQFACVCGRIGSPHITNWYESPCASWITGALADALAHVIPDYFSDDRKEMQRILDEKIFPESKYKKGGAEQDGFFLRCIEYHGWKTLFPNKPLATHLGWWGYNSPPLREKPTGAFSDRVEACRNMLRNIPRRRELFGHRITDEEVAGMK
ncbi:MAG TPA: glycosyltransferase [Candidatus Binatia bacterium]|nr:glycosyltransferase [Candidatus Binatia bacterium]